MTGTCLINNWCHKTSARLATKFDSRRLLQRNSKQHAAILKRHGELWLGYWISAVCVIHRVQSHARDIVS